MISLRDEHVIPAGDQQPALRAGLCDVGIWRSGWLRCFLGRKITLDLPFSRNQGGIRIGWGRKRSGIRAETRARTDGQECWLLEDGFLRSLGLGVEGCPPVSIIVDDLGMYYDATRPSRLELLVRTAIADDSLKALAEQAMQRILGEQLSKYNHAPSLTLPSLAAGRSGRVLVIDQAYGDVSVRLGGADRTTFMQMLKAALSDNPSAEIWIKAHPDVRCGKKKGYLPALPPDPRIRVLAEDASPVPLLKQVDKVYAVTSQLGFEALMAGKPVVCFGLPWYAGWGLTEDRHPAIATLRLRRNASPTVTELFAAAYLLYPRYIRPATGEPGTIFDAIDWLARNREANDALRGDIYCIGMSWWKRSIVRPFLSCPSARLHFAKSVAALAHRPPQPGSKVIIWGTRNEAPARELARRYHLRLWHMEDGFLRSAGLGSDLQRPLSLVLDTGGIYYDPETGSDLEKMLAAQSLTQQELDRAARFRASFVALRLSKYNLGGLPLQINSGGKKVLLVPGQVDDDGSVVRGSPVIRSNLALLRQVRAEHPDACIVYKPHPDVVAGNRQGALDQALLAGLADYCVPDADIVECIRAADEVHTMTSLAGFEALLHGRTVHCYGAPFYAGWGLTIDHMPIPHRQRQLTLDELVFAAMLKYPRYVVPGTRGLASAEDALAVLAAQARRTAPRVRRSGIAWALRQLRKARAIIHLISCEISTFRR